MSNDDLENVDDDAVAVEVLETGKTVIEQGVRAVPVVVRVGSQGVKVGLDADVEFVDPAVPVVGVLGRVDCLVPVAKADAPGGILVGTRCDVDGKMGKVMLVRELGDRFELAVRLN